jgi:hypothetical protein
MATPDFGLLRGVDDYQTVSALGGSLATHQLCLQLVVRTLWGCISGRIASHCADEPITAPGERFNVTGGIGVFAQSRAQTAHGRIQSRFEIHNASGPQPADEFFTRDHPSGVGQQRL